MQWIALLSSRNSRRKTEAHHEGVLATIVSVRRKESCDGYMGQLRANMVLLWLQGLPIDHKDGFCGHSVRHRLRVL